MEKENSRSREEARQQYNTTVLKLVELCKRLDPRYKKALEMKKEKEEKLEEEKRRREEELLAKMETCVTEVGTRGESED